MILAGAAGLAAVAVAYFVFFPSHKPEPEPDLDAERIAAAKLLVEKVGQMMTAGEFKAAAADVDGFLKQHPGTSGLSRLWALRIVCLRKSNESIEALLTVAAMADSLQELGADLCLVGEILVKYECYADAAKAFELAARDNSVRRKACWGAAICNYRLGQYAKAMEYIDVVAAMNPNDPNVLAVQKRIEDARFVMDE